MENKKGCPVDSLLLFILITLNQYMITSFTRLFSSFEILSM